MGADKEQLRKWAREEDCMAYCAKEEKKPVPLNPDWRRRLREQDERR